MERHLAWRRTGWLEWVVNGKTVSYWTINDGYVFRPHLLPQIGLKVADFDGDGADDIASPSFALAYCRVNSANNPLWTFPLTWMNTNDLKKEDIRVADFDGDGAMDICAKRSYGPAHGNEYHISTKSRTWMETSNGPSFNIEFIYTDATGDGTPDDYVLAVHYPYRDMGLIYQPLAIVYFLKTINVEIDPLFFQSLSPEQQRMLYDDCQRDPALQAGLTKTDPNGDSTYPNVVFNTFEFNLGADNINEMKVDVKYVAITTSTQWGAVSGQARVLQFEGDASPFGGQASLTVAQADVSYQSLSGEITVGQIEGKSYLRDDGFGIGGSTTVVAVKGTLGDSEATNVSAGVGFGSGGSVSGSWGDKDQYGFAMDVWFFHFGAYVSESDANHAGQTVVSVFSDGVNSVQTQPTITTQDAVNLSVAAATTAINPVAGLIMFAPTITKIFGF